MKADIECRRDLSVLLHILQLKGIIDDTDLKDMNNGIFRFKKRDEKEKEVK